MGLVSPIQWSAVLPSGLGAGGLYAIISENPP